MIFKGKHKKQKNNRLFTVYNWSTNYNYFLSSVGKGFKTGLKMLLYEAVL